MDCLDDKRVDLGMMQCEVFCCESVEVLCWDCPNKVFVLMEASEAEIEGADELLDELL